MLTSVRRSLKRVGTGRNASPLWNRALERYREELEETDDYEDIIGSGSLADLINYAKTIETSVPERTALNSLNRLQPILKFVDDFSAVIAICFGADAKLTAFVWGSIRLIITLASSAGDTLQNALDMLEELSLTLPRFRHYEDTLPMDSSFERALLDVYTEVICFYARSIHFFRIHPLTPLRRIAWGDFHGDFERTMRRLKHMSSVVESEADLARMRLENEKYGEVLQLLKGLKASKSNDDAVIHCYHIPASMSLRFWGRDEALSIVKAAIDPGETVESLKTFAIYGMGGVGKTQLALHYANSSKKEYDAVLWISADNTLSMEQSFRDVAQALGLVHMDEEAKDALSATLRVKHWLAEGSKSIACEDYH
jgi:ABC-type multidrug transport system fused ATPase/permease subunit